MSKHTCLIRAGHDTGKIGERTVSLSWKAKADVLITLQPADAEEQCRLSQLRLAWMWATDQANSGVGAYDDKSDCYWFFKTQFLAPVLAEDDAEFALLWDKLNGLKLLAGDHFHYQMTNKAISHDDATVSQVAKALRNWQDWCASNGIDLRDTDDYNFAMQLKSYEELAKVAR
jgi:hypothetical protein